MALKFLYDGDYFSKVGDAFQDYGAWSDECSGAGGLATDEAIENLMDCFFTKGIEIVDISMRQPYITLRNLRKKHEAYLKRRTDQSCSVKEYDGFIMGQFTSTDQVESVLREIKSGKPLLYLSFGTHSSFWQPNVEAHQHFLRKIGLRCAQTKGLIETSRLQRDETPPDQVILSAFAKHQPLDIGYGPSYFYIEKDLHYFHSAVKLYGKNVLLAGQYGHGRVVIAAGSLFSDFVLDIYSRSDMEVNDDRKNANHELACSVVEYLLGYEIPYFDIELLSPPASTWLTNEPYIVSLIVKNLGQDAQKVHCTFHLDRNVDALSPIEITWNELLSGESRQLNLILRTPISGSLQKILELAIDAEFGGCCCKKELTVLDRVNFFPISAAVRTNEEVVETAALLNRYQSIKSALSHINGFDAIVKLIDVDPSATLVKSRMLLEKLVNHMWRKSFGTLPQRLELGKKITRLENENIISRKLASWFRTVQHLGNISVHPEPEDVQITRDDALVMANVLLHIVNEMLDNALL
jgi:hypothetical protein